MKDMKTYEYIVWRMRIHIYHIRLSTPNFYCPLFTYKPLPFRLYEFAGEDVCGPHTKAWYVYCKPWYEYCKAWYENCKLW